MKKMDDTGQQSESPSEPTDKASISQRGHELNKAASLDLRFLT